MKLLPSLLLYGLLLCAGAAYADDESDLNNAIADLNGISKMRYAKGGAMYVVISDQTGVPANKLMADRSATKLSYGELLVAESLSAATGKSVQTIAAQKQAGQSWAAVSRQNKINPGSLTARLRTAGDQLHISESTYSNLRQNNLNENLGRMQGNAQQLQQRGILGR